MAKWEVKLLWLLASALVILLAACSGGSSRTPSRDISTNAVQVDGSRADSQSSENQSGVASEAGNRKLRVVKYTVPTIT